MTNKKRPEVGQVLYSLNVGNAARSRKQELTKVTVTKVGRKYFTCKREGYWREEKYHLDSWYEVSDYMATSRLYETPEQWEIEKEESRLEKVFSELFRDERSGLTIDQLKAIEKIVKGEDSE